MSLLGCVQNLAKKLKELDISVPIVYCNIAFWLGKKASEWVLIKSLFYCCLLNVWWNAWVNNKVLFRYQSHKWTVYVRGGTNEDISVVVKRVVFQLHSSFNNPTRVVDGPPFELSESGWGEFEIVITLHFHNDVCEKPLHLWVSPLDHLSVLYIGHSGNLKFR